MAQNPHEYLIEQLQFTGAESVGSSSNKIKLNFNHPCKELVFTVQKDYFVDCCKQFETGEQLYKALGVQPFNYTDCIDALPNAYHAFSGPNTAGDGEFIVSGLFADPGAGDGHRSEGRGTRVRMPMDGMPPRAAPRFPQAGTNPLSRTPAPLSSPRPLSTCTAGDRTQWSPPSSSSTDRTASRSAKEPTSTLVQPYQHHTRSPDTGINVYSFALRPEEHQPSGTCNFSRIDNATLQLVLSNDTVGGDDTAKVRVYATNYNVLRVMSGMGGLAYSN